MVWATGPHPPLPHQTVHAVAQLVELLRNNPEGRGFVS
jgi:hypothetical protein